MPESVNLCPAASWGQRIQRVKGIAVDLRKKHPLMRHYLFIDVFFMTGEIRAVRSGQT